MTIGTLLRFTRVLKDADRVIQLQNEKIAELEQTLWATSLQHGREMQAIVCSWLISLEKPEADMRHDLAALENALANQVAALEEHVL